MMNIESTKLEGCFVIEPQVLKDSRGLFFESFNLRNFYKYTGLNLEFVQDNQSISKKGIIRGLHYQEGEFAQSKLVRVLQGSVLDVVVDLRLNSKTFGQHFSIVLNSKNNLQLFIPRGFAHGFLSLENNTIFTYKCDNYYNKASEKGIIYNDKSLNINWGIDNSQVKVSKKDSELPTFENLFQ